MKVCVALAWIGIAWNLCARAQDAILPEPELDSVYVALHERVLALNPVEIAADPRNPAKSSLRPSQVLHMRALDQVPATSRIEALASLPGVDLVSNGAGSLRPMIRGLSGLRIATLFNGARVESQAWGEFHGIYLPEEGIQAVEVIRGPASLAFGSDAYGGVLNFIPRAPLSAQGRETRLGLTGFSATSGWQLTAATEKRSQSTFHAFRGGYKEHGNYRMPSGVELANSGYAQFFGQGTFGYIRPWGVIEGAYSSAYNSGGLIGHPGWQQSGDHMVTTSAHWNWRGWDLAPRLSYQLNHRKEFESEFGEPVSEGDEAHPELALDISLRTLRWEATAHRSTWGRWASTWGIQGFQLDSRFDDDGSAVLVHEPLIPDAQVSEQSAFTVWKRDRTDWGMQVAGRVDHRATQGPSSRVDWLLGWGGGAHWNLNDRLTLRSHVAHSERVPGLSELYSQGVHHCAFRIEEGNASLNKERSFNVETSLDWAFKGLRLEAVVYHHDIRNFTYISPTGRKQEGWSVFAWESADAVFRGGELSGAWNRRHLRMDVAASVVDARQRTGATLPLIPPATVRSTLGLHELGHDPMRGLFVQAVVQHNRDATLVHAAAGGQLGERVTLNVSVQNVLNTEFIPTLSLLRDRGIPEPGRNVRLQLTWTL